MPRLLNSLALCLFLLPAIAGAAEPQPRPLDAAKIEEMKAFVSDAMAKLGIPGVGLAFVYHGQIVFEGGLGWRAMGKPEPVDAHTRFMIGSNSKGLTTLMLARLVDQGKLDWNEPVTQAYPAFHLGDEEATKKERVRDLVCACSGFPRKDMIWIVGTRPDTRAAAIFDQLAQSKPTTGIGETFQYSNLLAAAGGYVGGAVAYPGKELGAAYDAAMLSLVFRPLGMNDTTFDMAGAQKGDFASPHGGDQDGQPRPGSLAPDYVILPYRPAGGAWSSAHDMIRYVALELSQGLLPDGERLVSAKNLLERRVPSVAMSDTVSYGMGLVTDRSAGITLIRHGGGIAGYRSDITILPEADVGAVILTNGGASSYLLRPFMHRLEELLFDREPKAAGEIDAALDKIKAAQAKNQTLTVPAAPDLAAKLKAGYGNDELGSLRVRRENGRLFFDFPLYSSEMASKVTDQGAVTFTTISPTAAGLDFTLTDAGLTLKEFAGDYSYLYR